MPERTISQTFLVGVVPTNATSAKLSDPTGTFGIKRNDTDATVVVDNTALTNVSTGVYQYTFTALNGVAYTAYIEFVFDGDTIYKEVLIPASSEFGTMVCSYSSLLERVGHELFGIRSGFSAGQTTDILQCINDGLHYVYTAHDWSFFRPVKDITTTAPYATGTVTIAAGVVTLTGGTFPSWAADGILKVSNAYYSVATRDSNTQLTLDTTSLTVASATAFQLARPEVPLSESFEAVANDSDLTYYPDQNQCYPPVRQRHDQFIRAKQRPHGRIRPHGRFAETAGVLPGSRRGLRPARADDSAAHDDRRHEPVPRRRGDLGATDYRSLPDVGGTGLLRETGRPAHAAVPGNAAPGDPGRSGEVQPDESRT
jgi:hypothetical protein